MPCGQPPPNRLVTRDAILVAAPDNDHRASLDGVLDDRVRGVGTVDRFQGREGRFGFLSMATSTPETAPRGMVRRARRHSC